MRKKANYLMLISDVIEAMDQLAMANNVLWCGHVLRRKYDSIRD